ncbi:hypothetical protein CFAEC_05620 [Corynebacterium faecale]|uniref:hypothetical protein n=1 Tax=Corynebacterium faecale TaxID=1758466 RepID=UPI0025B615A9|nr:hypothetical protein [Corynebacterium faecale]WJY91962.1 hypothetical protein CFAEC_05620 [Corynebacterium faecale]
MRFRNNAEKRATELRLLTATVYLKALNQQWIREDLVSTDILGSQTPMIPTTSAALLSDVYIDACEHFENGATTVMVPFINASPFTLSVLTLSDTDVDELDGSQTVSSLFEMLSPKKSWSLTDLYSDDQESVERLTRSVTRLTTASL